MARRYEITGNLKDKKTVEFFWNHVVNNHSYVTGGHGNHEYFGQPDQLRNRLSDETTETCNVYNMLKLSRHLFQWNPRAEVADFYERDLFNHILSSQNPENGRVTYFLSLEMGGYKSFQDPESFTCCIGTAMESHSKYGRNIFYKGEDELYVSQFIASTVHWEEKNIVITQKTNFPQEQETKIIIDKADSQQFTLYIRYPSWAEKGINILFNGKHQEINQQPGSFVAIKRTWNAGDSINVSFPYTLRLEPMPDDTNRIAVLYGPLVLAGVLSAEDDPKANNSDYVPVLFPKDRDPNNWLSPIEDAYNTFKISEDIAKPQGFILKPLYTIYDRRYSVYWDLYDKERWKQYQLNIKAEIERKKKLEEKTLDFFQPGNAQQEMNHSFDGENTNVIEFKNRNARVADRGGWFSFELNVKQNIAITLVVEYWGGFTGSKTFDILIDGNKIATENIADKKDGQFIEVQYDIKSKLITNKNRITVTFSPHWGNRAGPVFGARTIMQ